MADRIALQPIHPPIHIHTVFQVYCAHHSYVTTSSETLPLTHLLDFWGYFKCVIHTAYIPSNDRMIAMCELDRLWKAQIKAYFKLLSHCLTRKTE